MSAKTSKMRDFQAAIDLYFIKVAGYLISNDFARETRETRENFLILFLFSRRSRVSRADFLII